MTMSAPAAPISMARPGLVTAIAVLQFFGAALMLIFAIAAFALPSSGTQADRGAFMVFGAFTLVFAVASLVTGIGLWKMADWGRTLQIVLACIGLLAIPLGTIISILLLVYFTRPHVKILFSGKRRDQLTPEETAIMASAGGGGGASAVIIAIVALLVIVGFIGIIAAIAIPNLMTAMQRSKQKRTMADIRTMATSVEEYRAANNRPPESITIMKDGWGNNVRYASDGTTYWIVSAGRDGKFEEAEAWHYRQGGTTNFDCDVVFSNGEFRQYPEGVQQR
jgi:general secretion pathway protein G